jgi:N-terminal phage replisome organiser (Phage_rep_org_N)
MSRRGFDSMLVEIKLGGNRKFRRLSPPERWCAVFGVWAIAAQSPVRGTLLIAEGVAAVDEDFAAEADVTVAVARSTLAKMRELRMLEQDEDGVECVHDWDKHQPEPRPSETPEERRRRKREQRERERSPAGYDDVTRDSAEGHDDVTTRSRSRSRSRRGRGTDQQTASIDPREEVIGLCNRLADGIKRNDPKWTGNPAAKVWVDEMRKLLDIDGRSVDEVECVIDWCETDSHARSTVLSPLKLRKRFTELVMKTQEAGQWNVPEEPGALGFSFRKPRASFDAPIPAALEPSTPELAAKWEPIATQLALVVEEGIYDNWLGHLHLHDTSDGLVIGCGNRGQRQWITERFGRAIQASVELVLGAEAGLEVVECGCAPLEQAA